jgi:maleamate amidohydrolase
MTIGTKMICENKTARQLFEEVMANPARKKFGFGEKLAIVNVDVQQAYTRLDKFKTSYETDPRQIEHINTISRLARDRDMPVIWSHVAYKADAGDAGIWGTRTDTEDSLQNIKYGSERHAFDQRLYQADAERLFRNTAGQLSVMAQGRHRRRDRRFDVGLRPRHCR